MSHQPWGSRGQWRPWGSQSLSSSSLGPSSPLRNSNSIILQTEPWVLLHFPGCDGLSSRGAWDPQGQKKGRNQPGAQEWAWSPAIMWPAVRGKRNVWLIWFRGPSWPDSERIGTNTQPARSGISLSSWKNIAWLALKTWFMFMDTRYTPEKLKNRNYFHLLLVPWVFWDFLFLQITIPRIPAALQLGAEPRLQGELCSGAISTAITWHHSRVTATPPNCSTPCILQLPG